LPAAREETEREEAEWLVVDEERFRTEHEAAEEDKHRAVEEERRLYETEMEARGSTPPPSGRTDKTELRPNNNS